MNKFFMAGRVEDRENHYKLVEAEHAQVAQELFETHVRAIEEQQEGDFYIDHCDTIVNMQKKALK